MSANEIEHRSIVIPVERRDADGEESMGVAGYAAVFGQKAQICDDFAEVFARGAFSQSVRSADVRAYFGHDRTRVLGRTKARTLRLKEDNRGLAVEIDLPDTTDGRDARTLIARGDVSGMSIGFRTIRDEWDMSQQPALRTIHEVELLEVSIVSEPAYEGTSIALRSLDAARNEQRQKNFSAAARRVGMKISLDLTTRLRSKA